MNFAECIDQERALQCMMGFLLTSTFPIFLSLSFIEGGGHFHGFQTAIISNTENFYGPNLDFTIKKKITELL